MIPTVTQQLRSMRTRLVETVVPALPEEAGFAREQSLLMAATLDWLIDTHEHEYRYQVVENHEYRELVAALVAGQPTGPVGSLDPADAAEAAELLGRSAPAPEAVATGLGEIAAQNQRLKELVERVHAARTRESGSESAAHSRALLASLARRQVARELAWFRMTGFPQAPEGVGAVLDAGTVPTARAGTHSGGAA